MLLCYIWHQNQQTGHVSVELHQTEQNNHLFPTTTTMKPLSAADTNHILTLLDSGLSGEQISSHTGLSNATISRIRSRHCPYLTKAPGVHPAKLSDANI